MLKYSCEPISSIYDAPFPLIKEMSRNVTYSKTEDPKE